MVDEAASRVRDISSDTNPKITWDDSHMKSSYANVCNVASTREEMVLFFGISNPSQSGEREVTVQLSDRLILSPFAAKRLALMLNRVVEQHEARFGKLGTEPEQVSTTAKASKDN